jgi:hypothetical protein
MINHEEIRRHVAERYNNNTEKVKTLLLQDYDLRNLESVFDHDLCEVYREVLPRYANLCETNQSRKLDATERALLAVSYASLHASFGDEGTILLGATWLATKPYRQAAGS